MIHTRTKIIAGIATGVSVASLLVLIGFFVVLERYKSTFTAEQEAAFATKNQKAQLTSIEKLVNDTKAEREELSRLILTEEKVVMEFLPLIETLAREQGVELETRLMPPAVTNTRFTEIDVTLSVEGRKKSVEHMIKLIESLPYRSSLEKVTLTRASEEKESLLWQGDVTLKVAIYKEK